MNLQEFHSNVQVTDAIAASVEATLRQIGEDPQREGLKKTPHRVGEALQFLCKGYQEDPEAILRSALFEEDYRQMVVVKDIDFYSLCEHHMLPFFGKERSYHGLEQDCPRGRCVRPPAAGSGAADDADQGLHPEHA